MILYQNDSLESIRANIKDLRELNIEKEKIDNEKLIHFYENFQSENPAYLSDYGFKYKDSDKWKIPPATYNITKFVIDKISLLYKRAPERYLDDLKVEEGGKDPWGEWTMSNRRFQMAMMNLERYKKLLHIVLFRPVFDVWRKKWKFFIEHDFIPHFTQDDRLNPFAFSIPIKPNLQDPKEVDAKGEIYLFVSDEYMFYHNKDGDSWTDYRLPNGEIGDYEGKNPFEIMPLVEVREGMAVTQYRSNGAKDLVGCNEQINVAMMDVNLMIHNQAFGLLWDDTGMTKDDAQIIEISPNAITHMPKGTSLNALDMGPMILECAETVQRELQFISKTYGVNMNMTMEGSAVSGFSLMVQNIDLLEAREADIPEAELYETETYEVISKMQNWYKNNTEYLGDEILLPLDKRPITNFSDIDFPINQKEELDMRDWYINHNIKTPLDYMDSDLDDEEKMVKYLENKKINGKLTAREQLTETFTKLGVEVEE